MSGMIFLLKNFLGRMPYLYRRETWAPMVLGRGGGGGGVVVGKG